MKAIKLLIASGSFVLLLASSCTRENDALPNRPALVQFATGSIDYPQTRLGSEGTAFVDNDSIGIFMMQTGQKVHEFIDQGGSQKRYVAKPDGSILPHSTADALYYPLNGSNVDFVAYYPYHPNLDSYMYDFSITANDKDYLTKTIIYANSGENKSTGYNKNSTDTVQLAFRHLLARLTVQLKPGDGAPTLQGAKVELNNFIIDGTVNLIDGIIDKNVAVMKDLQLYDCSSPDINEWVASVIPQTSLDPKLVIILADRKSKFEWNITTPTFEAGCHYTYELTVDKTGITASIEEIKPWIVDDNPIEEVNGGNHYIPGDYYPDPRAESTDGGITWKGIRPIGVVWYVNERDSCHGKLVGFDELANVPWSTYTELISADHTGDGIKNMEMIFKFLTSPNKPWDGFPAFKWVHKINAPAENYGNSSYKGIWYLPGSDELANLSTFLTEGEYGLAEADFNKKITDAGGEAIQSNVFYWSSTEYSYDKAYNYNLTGMLPGIVQKTQRYPVRCMMDF